MTQFRIPVIFFSKNTIFNAQVLHNFPMNLVVFGHGVWF
jgi:hypothetical protein